MQTIQTTTYSNYFHLKGQQISRIYFYNDNGLINHSCDYDLRDEEGNKVGTLNVLHILQHDKSFKKEETEQEFIKKQMNKKINFSYIVKERRWSTTENNLILYLYVDGEFLKQVKSVDTVEVSVNDYDLSKTYYYYNELTLDFDGQIVVHKHLTDTKQVEETDIQEQAKRIFEECIYKIAYIQQSEFNRIFNQYELVKREKPLLTKDIPLEFKTLDKV